MKARTIITVCVALLRPHEQENDSWIPLAIESDSVVLNARKVTSG